MHLRFALTLTFALTGCSEPPAASPDLAPRATARIGVLPDVVGFATALDGTTSTGPMGETPTSYEWHFASVPQGSAISDAALSSTTDGKVRFEPDLGGDYQIALTITTPGDGSDTATRTFTVPTIPIFFYEGTGMGTTAQLGVGMIRSDGTGRRTISCPIMAGVGPDGGAEINPFQSLRFAGLYGMRTWDPPAGVAAPSRNVYLEIVPSTDGTVSDFRLWAADERSDCSTTPSVRIDSTGLTNDHAHFWPRFSADGNRVLYVDKPQDQAAFTYRLVTIGFDRNQQRAIRSGMVNFHNAPPVWLDATHVAWIENVSTTSTPHLVMYAASDANQAGDSDTAPGDRTVLLDCDGPGGATGTPMLTIINQFAIVNGTIVLSGAVRSPFANPNPGQFDLYVMTPGQCSLAKPLTQQPVHGFAWDFDVSPDGKQLVFSGGTIPGDLYLVPTDGSSAPVLFAGDPKFDDIGPRFVAGGRQIVWTQAADSGPPAGAGLLIANLDGSHLRALAPEGGLMSARVLAGSNQGTACAYTTTAAPPTALLVLSLLFLGVRARRRRR
jgi:hypothetical protein